MLRDLFFDIGRLGLPPETQPVVWLIALIWAAFIAESAGLITIPNLVPRGDLLGVITHTLGHANLGHILSNSLSLAPLAYLYLLYTPEPWLGFAVMAFVPGLISWATASVESRGISGFVAALAGWAIVFAVLSGLVLNIFFAVPFIVFVAKVLPLVNPFSGHSRIDMVGHFWGFAVGCAWTFFSLADAGQINPTILDASQSFL